MTKLDMIPSCSLEEVQRVNEESLGIEEGIKKRKAKRKEELKRINKSSETTEFEKKMLHSNLKYKRLNETITQVQEMNKGQNSYQSTVPIVDGNGLNYKTEGAKKAK